VARIRGTRAPDPIIGTEGDDVISARGGNDKVFARGGNDMVVVGSGSDEVDAGAGDDVVFGRSGSDVLRGDSPQLGVPGLNLVANGSFEDTTGMKPTEFGVAGDIPGWTNANEDVRPEVVDDGWVGMPASDGEYWLDLGTGNRKVLDISQQVEDVVDGATYELAFDAGQWQAPSAAPDETMNVYWNGELIATIRPTVVGEWETYSFKVEGGSGDGTNTLRFEGVTDGSSDSQGVTLDNVSLSAVPQAFGDDMLFGGSGRDALFGEGGNDTLAGGRGNDLNVGGDGEDLFMFRLNDGTDMIEDFEQGVDQIGLFGASVLAPGALGAGDVVSVEQVGDDARVGFGNTTIILVDTAASEVDESDFLLV